MPGVDLRRRDRWQGLSEEERGHEMDEYVAVSRRRDELAATSSTRPRRRRRSASAATRRSSGRPLRRVEGDPRGYYVFECDSIDEACTWAAKIPAARLRRGRGAPVYDDGGETS